MEARIGDVIRAAATVFNITPEKIMEKRRFTEQVRARQMVHLVAKEFGHSYPRIGMRLGGCDHTTVMHGERKMAKLAANSREWERMVNATRELAVVYNRRSKEAGMTPVPIVEKAPAPVPVPVRTAPDPKPITVQQSNDALMLRRCNFTEWGEEFGQQYVTQRGVYAMPGTADGERKLLAALRREHPDKEIDLKEAKDYGGKATVAVEKIPH